MKPAPPCIDSHSHELSTLVTGGIVTVECHGCGWHPFAEHEARIAASGMGPYIRTAISTHLFIRKAGSKKVVKIF